MIEEILSEIKTAEKSAAQAWLSAASGLRCALGESQNAWKSGDYFSTFLALKFCTGGTGEACQIFPA